MHIEQTKKLLILFKETKQDVYDTPAELFKPAIDVQKEVKNY